MNTLSLHGQTIKIHASIADLDKVIENGIRGAIEHRDVFVPGQPEYEKLLNELHDLAKSAGIELDPSEIPQEFFGYQYGVKFDEDGQLSYESRKRIAQFVINELDSAKIVVSVREEKTIGFGANFKSDELASHCGIDGIAKCTLGSIGLARCFKKRDSDLARERVEVKAKGGAVAGIKTE